MSNRIGLECVVHLNTATFATPTWVVVENVRDVTTTLDKTLAEMRARSKEWVSTRKGLKNASVEMELLYDPTDTDFAAFLAEFLSDDNDDVLDLAILDAPVATSNSQGLRAEFHVESMGRSEPLEEGVVVPFTLRIADTANAPAWMDVT